MWEKHGMNTLFAIKYISEIWKYIKDYQLVFTFQMNTTCMTDDI